MSASELRTVVQKESDDRLKAELKRAKPKTDPAVIESMTREVLVTKIVELRLQMGIHTSIKTAVPEKEKVLVPAPHTVGAEMTPVTTMDPTTMIMMLIQQQRETEERRAIADAQERKERREAEERRAAVEAQERKERREAEERRVAVEAQEKKERREAEIQERREQREFEQRRIEAEANERRERAEAKEKRNAEKVELEEARRQKEKEEADIEAEAVERRHKEQMEELRRTHAVNAERENKRENRLKNGHAMMRGCLSMMNDDPLTIPVFFENVERQFEDNHIQNDIKIALIQPFLSQRCKEYITKLPLNETNTYQKLKTAILKEYHLTPSKYRKTYMDALKDKSESFVQYNTRLQVLLNYYLTSRNVNGDYQRLINLLIRDHFLDSLHVNVRKYIREKEGEDWFPPDRVARIADEYADENPSYAPGYNVRRNTILRGAEENNNNRKWNSFDNRSRPNTSNGNPRIDQRRTRSYYQRDSEERRNRYEDTTPASEYTEK